MKTWLWLGLVAAAALAPEVGHACPVCFSASDDSRNAFALTTALLTALPLTMIGSVAWWMWRQSARLRAEEAADGEPLVLTPLDPR